MLLIKNATIHDGLENVFAGDILIEDGKIVKVGENLSADCEVYDATDKHVFPGFIDPMSNWGILGPGREIRGNAEDNDERSNVINPEMNIIYAFNGRGATRQQLGAFGITTVGVAPSNTNLFGGMMAVFEADGINPFKMCLKEKVGQKACVGRPVTNYHGAKNLLPSTYMGVNALIEKHLQEAKEYDESKGRDVKKAALKEVVDKKMPLFVYAKGNAEVRNTLHVTKDYDLDMVLCSGYGLEGFEDEIVARNISVLVNNADGGFDPYQEEMNRDVIYDLYKKGVLVGLASDCSGSMVSREDLLWTGIGMYKVCHDAEACIKMMTSNTAKILGVDDLTGSIEEGKRADLVIYSDHPIKTYAASVELTLCGGRTIYKKGDAMKCFI